MLKITFIEDDGTEHVVEAESGSTLMSCAVKHSVPGIEADCGGACSCATCHVYVDAAWIEAVGPQGDMEALMLEYAEGLRETSRLSCQITASPALDGLVLRLPASQR